MEIASRFFNRNLVGIISTILCLAVLPSVAEAQYGGGGGGGGSLYHRECYQNQCSYIIGAGPDTCSYNIECIGNGNQNSSTSNGNINGVMNQNVNSGTNSNINGGGTTNSNVNAGGKDYFFKDVGNHWARGYAEKIKDACGIQGYKDEYDNLLYQFRPDDYITRAEIVAWSLKCKQIDPGTPTSNPFLDVNRFTWYGPYVARAKILGWISGYPDKLFRPNQYVNRVEATKILVLRNFTWSQVVGGLMEFIDTLGGSWYEKYVAFAVMKGYVEGYRDAAGNLTGWFGPADNITRAEAAKIIVNINGF